MRSKTSDESDLFEERDILDDEIDSLGLDE